MSARTSSTTSTRTAPATRKAPADRKAPASRTSAPDGGGRAPASSAATTTPKAPTLTHVTDLLVATANTAAAALGAVDAADAAFKVSAVQTALLLDKVKTSSTTKVAAAVAKRVEAGEADARTAYTSATAIGWHAMTGRMLALPGDAPTFTLATGVSVAVHPFELQRMVKVVGQTEAATILGASKSVGDAYRGLVAKCRAMGREAATPEAKATGTGRAARGTGPTDTRKAVTRPTTAPATGGKATVSVPAPPITPVAGQTFASLTRNALQILQGAAKVGVKSADDRVALADLLKFCNALSASGAAAPAARNGRRAGKAA
jgi:hypothetical protein